MPPDSLSLELLTQHVGIYTLDSENKDLLPWADTQPRSQGRWECLTSALLWSVTLNDHGMASFPEVIKGI